MKKKQQEGKAGPEQFYIDPTLLENPEDLWPTGMKITEYSQPHRLVESDQDSSFEAANDNSLHEISIPSAFSDSEVDFASSDDNISHVYENKDQLAIAEDFLAEMSESSSDSEPDTTKARIKPVNYLSGERVDIHANVYSLTIAALITGRVTMRERNFALGQCIYCFTCQTLVALYFGLEYLGFDRFSLDAFDVPNTTIRLVCSVLLQMTLNQELLEATKLLTWLK